MDKPKRVYKFPPILFLGNEISLSLGALKDIIQVGISQGFLVAVIIGGYLIQDLNNAKERGKTTVSYTHLTLPTTPYV